MKEVEHFAIKSYALFGLGVKLAGNIKGLWVVGTANKVMGLRVTHKMFNMVLVGDNYDLEKAYYLAISLILK